MPAAFSQFFEPELPQALARLRIHAALARALLDELDRLAPPSARRANASRFVALGEQLAEELGRLGRQISECAMVINGMASEAEAAE